MTYPKNSPVVINGVAHCKTCAQPMLRKNIQQIGTGELTGVILFCDSEGCKYGWDVSLQYLMGTAVPYVKPKEPEPKFVPPVGEIKKFPGTDVTTEVKT